MRGTPPALTIQSASEVATAALSFLAEEPTRIERFFALTGMTPATLRQSAGELWVEAALLDHLLHDESLLLAFAAHARVPATDVQAAFDVLTRG